MATTTAAAPTHAKVHAQTGLWSWITTVDHKRIAVLYFFTSLFFFLVGGLEAFIIRLQLAVPNGHVVSAQMYNSLFTMHATTMIFLALMPLSVAFFNFVVPLQIGARDVAFPRLNAFSYWVFLFAGIFPNDPEHLRAWIKNAPAMKPGSLMPAGSKDMNLSNPDVEALAAYLETRR